MPTVQAGPNTKSASEPTKVEKFGIIITRHMTTNENAEYWRYCIRLIRLHHPEIPVVIIDDNSDANFLSNALRTEEKQVYKCRVIYSEYKGHGEFLPYYYYSLPQNQSSWFENALIIHDSVFIARPLNNLPHVFDILDKHGFLFLWHFETFCLYDDPTDEVKLIRRLKGGDDIVRTIYADNTTWSGCFGGMAFISQTFLSKLNDTYSLSSLVNHITTRRNRMSFERLIACTMIHAGHDKNNKTYQVANSYLGNIHKYCKWNIKYHEVMHIIVNACLQPCEYIADGSNPSLIKVWSGR